MMASILSSDRHHHNMHARVPTAMHHVLQVSAFDLSMSILCPHAVSGFIQRGVACAPGQYRMAPFVRSPCQVGSSTEHEDVVNKVCAALHSTVLTMLDLAPLHTFAVDVFRSKSPKGKSKSLRPWMWAGVGPPCNSQTWDVSVVVPDHFIGP